MAVVELTCARCGELFGVLRGELDGDPEDLVCAECRDGSDDRSEEE